ncbi:MAG: hypothetical protein AB7N80_00375 [Bdellovibrionales bacterium]
MCRLSHILFATLFSFQVGAQDSAKKEADSKSSQKTLKKVEAKIEDPVVAKRREPLMLTAEEQRTLSQGEISTAAHIIGGVIGTYPGFGLGHAIQGRYSEKGWIFTVGELGSLAVLMAGLEDCVLVFSEDDDEECDRKAGLVAIGALGYMGFHLWEIFDVWWGPYDHNNRYRLIRSRVDYWNMNGYLAPTKDGAMVGLQITF